MRALFIVCIGSIALAAGTLAQSPAVSSVASPAPTASATASAAPTASTPGSTDLGDRIQQRLEKKFKSKGFHFGVDSDERGAGDKAHEDIPAMVLPIVGIVFLTIFGAPVLIVAVIMYFGFSKNRMMHRTVRLMVEKGQPVPEALLNPPPAQRQRSDMRRGVVLVMVGLGLMLFLGAVNDWEGGAWALGIIPFLIGAGYLLVWKLERQKAKPDNPPPLP
jgi:hypothetical protein